MCRVYLNKVMHKEWPSPWLCKLLCVLGAFNLYISHLLYRSLSVYSVHIFKVKGYNYNESWLEYPVWMISKDFKKGWFGISLNLFFRKRCKGIDTNTIALEWNNQNHKGNLKKLIEIKRGRKSSVDRENVSWYIFITCHARSKCWRQCRTH